MKQRKLLVNVLDSAKYMPEEDSALTPRAGRTARAGCAGHANGMHMAPSTPARDVEGVRYIQHQRGVRVACGRHAEGTVNTRAGCGSDVGSHAGCSFNTRTGFGWSHGLRCAMMRERCVLSRCVVTGVMPHAQIERCVPPSSYTYI